MKQIQSGQVLFEFLFTEPGTQLYQVIRIKRSPKPPTNDVFTDYITNFLINPEDDA